MPTSRNRASSQATVRQAAKLYRIAHGYTDPNPDTVRRIVADPVRGRRIAQDYVAGDGTWPRRANGRGLAEECYSQFATEIAQQYRFILETTGMLHRLVDNNPYPDSQDMFEDVSYRNWLDTLSTESTGGHPYLTNQQNDMFRFVHDVFGHYASQRGFDRNGEDAAWYVHSHMFSWKARRALTTETRGQNSVFNWFNNGKEFTEEKIIILSDEYVKLDSITLGEAE